jgi:DNA processing protein
MPTRFPIHRFLRFHPSALLPFDLWDLPRPPLELHIQGETAALDLLQHLPTQGLAVVGTRGPQPRTAQLVRRELEDLAGSGLIVLSGLARGIDSVAHEAAIDAGLRTIAILGTGLDTTYPPENASLRERILETGGLIVSEFADNEKAHPAYFLHRNRVIAGWARATLVVEAAKRSGSLNTAMYARRLNRDCYAVPCFPGDPSLAGNQNLIDRDDAVPFWGARSLASTWPDLTSHLELKRRAALRGETASGKTDPAFLLAEAVRGICTQKGSASVDELLDWAVSSRWAPQDFFLALHSAIQRELVVDHQGLLTHAGRSKSASRKRVT